MCAISISFLPVGCRLSFLNFCDYYTAIISKVKPKF
nr:MAG TPA: Tick histamine binding protein [Caudoviricetes sp.]